MARASRMQREIQNLTMDPPPGVSCWPINDSIDNLEAMITGPENSPYHGGIFKLEITIPNKYPFDPPCARFITPIYHPNIDTNGRICLDALKSQPRGSWSPSMSISTILQCLRLLLSEPNPSDPLMAEIAQEFTQNHQLFLRNASAWTAKHATQHNNPLPQEQTAQESNNLSESMKENSKSDESKPGECKAATNTTPSNDTIAITLQPAAPEINQQIDCDVVLLSPNAGQLQSGCSTNVDDPTEPDILNKRPSDHELPRKKKKFARSSS